jgi:hypothetical protein
MKVVKAEFSWPTGIKVKLDDGVTKWLPVHDLQHAMDHPYLFSYVVGGLGLAMMGSTVETLDDGTVILNGKDVYTPNEIEQAVQDHMPIDGKWDIQKRREREAKDGKEYKLC